MIIHNQTKTATTDDSCFKEVKMITSIPGENFRNQWATLQLLL